MKDRRATLTDEIESLEADIEDADTEDDYSDVMDIHKHVNQLEFELGRRKVAKSQFDLHIVRSTESGTTYEDTVDNLSESEREVTGLMFALAGYLVHDIHETVPFMLLDSMI